MGLSSIQFKDTNSIRNPPHTIYWKMKRELLSHTSPSAPVYGARFARGPIFLEKLTCFHGLIYMAKGWGNVR